MFFPILLALFEWLQFKELFWRELFWSKVLFGARYLVKFKELFRRELFDQVQRAVLARAIWSSSISCFGAMVWRELFGQALRAGFGASYGQAQTITFIFRGGQHLVDAKRPA